MTQGMSSVSYFSYYINCGSRDETLPGRQTRDGATLSLPMAEELGRRVLDIQKAKQAEGLRLKGEGFRPGECKNKTDP